MGLLFTGNGYPEAKSFQAAMRAGGTLEATQMRTLMRSRMVHSVPDCEMPVLVMHTRRSNSAVLAFQAALLSSGGTVKFAS